MLASRADQSIEMVFASGKNGWVPDGQKLVDGRSKWRAGTRKTNVRLDGWCEDGLGQQNDGGGCASMREKSERVHGEPWYICNWMGFNRLFLIGPVFFRTALPWYGGNHIGRGGMPLHDAVGINCKIKALVSSIWAKWCMFDDCVCVIWLDMTTLRLWRDKKWYNIIILIIIKIWYFNYSISANTFYPCNE